MKNNMKAFATYRLPGEQSFISIGTSQHICIDNKIDFTKNNRFYITSFDKKVIAYFSPEERLDNAFFTCNHQLNTAPNASKKSSYKHQVESIKRKIQTNKFEKIVLSRIKIENKPSKLNEQQLFLDLCEAYPQAFVYMYYSELTGLWLGASPELLLSKAEHNYQTVALAGTKLINEPWTNKEEVEQQFVTDFITNTIENKCKMVQISSRYDSIIGNIKHLKTDISFEPYLTDEINSIIDQIQPTPAVCGIPKQEAMEYIKKLESHSRSFYTGAIGPVGINNCTSLFVNLRCMQVCKENLVLYVGGGITKDSVADSEWEETERKSKVLSNIIFKSTSV